jgi:hypothetical protein
MNTDFILKLGHLLATQRGRFVLTNMTQQGILTECTLIAHWPIFTHLQTRVSFMNRNYNCRDEKATQQNVV